MWYGVCLTRILYVWIFSGVEGKYLASRWFGFRYHRQFCFCIHIYSREMFCTIKRCSVGALSEVLSLKRKSFIARLFQAGHDITLTCTARELLWECRRVEETLCILLYIWWPAQSEEDGEWAEEKGKEKEAVTVDQSPPITTSVKKSKQAIHPS